MELLKHFIDIFLHLDKFLGQILQNYGGWTYALLFLVVFCETGLVVTPFLPGDSLLFATGAFAAKGSFTLDGELSPGASVLALFGLIAMAAILGDTVNYWIGRKLGPAFFGRFINKKHLDKTRAFYERHGGKTIIIARFVPIIRTFAPFVAGVGEMRYRRFIAYNIVGGVAWVGICICAGWFFGNLAWVQNNFSVVIIAIVLISIMPAVIEILRERARSKKESASPETNA